MKFLITENQMRRLEFKYLDYLFEDMYEVESKKYPDVRYFIKDNKEILLELEKSGRLYVSNRIWKDIKNMFSLDSYEVQQLIKEWVEQHLELEGIIPLIPI